MSIKCERRSILSVPCFGCLKQANKHYFKHCIFIFINIVQADLNPGILIMIMFFIFFTNVVNYCHGNQYQHIRSTIFSPHVSSTAHRSHGDKGYPSICHPNLPNPKKQHYSNAKTWTFIGSCIYMLKLERLQSQMRMPFLTPRVNVSQSVQDCSGCR